MRENDGTQKMVRTGLFVAVLAVISQLALPMPMGVPLTLQTFAVALIGVLLGTGQGAVVVGVYILTGAVGAPIFSNFQAGMGVITGKAGGFLWGFFFLAALSGKGGRAKRRFYGILLGILGLLICHFWGVLQFMAVSGMDVKTSFLFISFPYLPKDIFSVIIAFVIGWRLRRRIRFAAGTA